MKDEGERGVERTDAERKVIELLRGGRALSPEIRRRIVSELPADERKALQRIALGEVALEDPRQRGKAISALGMAEQAAESRAVLRKLLRSPIPYIQIKAIQALQKQGKAEDVSTLRELIRDPSAHPGPALAAARVVASREGADAVADLVDLRRRLLPLVPDERSPSIVALDRLIQEARGELPPPPPGPKPIA